MSLFSRPLHLIPLLGVIVALAVLSSYAYANAVTYSVSIPNMGDGSTAVAGYDVTALSFTLNGPDPALVDSISLTVDSDPTGAGTMQVELVASSGTWYTCTNVTTVLTCVTTAPQATVAAVDQIRLLIAP
jgi:hypothetical protein